MEQFLGWWNYPGAVVPRPSHPVVHPAPAADAAAQRQGQEQEPAQGQGQEAAPAAAAAAAAQLENANANAPPPGVVMVDLLGAPGTRWGLCTRLAQAILAAAAIGFMASTNDFHQITAFRLLVAAAILQCLWTLAGCRGRLRTPSQALLPDSSSYHHYFHWGLGHGICDLCCSECIGGHHHSHQQRHDAVLGEPLPELHGRHRHGFPELVRDRTACLFNLMAAVYRVQRA